MIFSKVTDKIKKATKTSKQYSLETVANEHDKEIPKERYISPKESIILDEYRLV